MSFCRWQKRSKSKTDAESGDVSGSPSAKKFEKQGNPLDKPYFHRYNNEAALNGLKVETSPAHDSEPVMKERQVQSMHAIIETGGKQYKVAEGDVIYIEKIDAQVDSTVSFDVLLVGNDGDVKIGTPVVEGVKVEGKVVGQIRGEKIVVYKYKSKKNYRRKQGHRQPYTKVEITKIG